MAGKKEKEQAGGERWMEAIVNLSEMSANLESLQKILAKKAVFVDDDTAKASLIAEQARNIKAPEQRVGTLERELDAAIAAAARASSEKRQPELSWSVGLAWINVSTLHGGYLDEVFELHMKELRRKQEDISKKDCEIKVLEAAIQTLSRNGSSTSED